MPGLRIPAGVSVTGLNASSRSAGALRLAIILWTTFTSATVLAQSNPVTVVDVAVERFSAAAQAHRERAGSGETRGIVAAFVNDYADFDRASVAILGKYSDSASPEQRQRLARALERRVITLLSEFILDLRFENIALEPFDDRLDRPPVTVKVRVPFDDGYIIDLHLVMHDGRGSWRIIDVVTEGVSYVRTYRTEFGYEVLKYGLDTAIERFEPDRS